MHGETNLHLLLTTLKPKLNEGEFVFLSLEKPVFDLAEVLFFFKETEGTTVVCSKKWADERGFAYQNTFAWITLEVHSSLEAVGLTAAFSTALAQNGLSCNVVAGFFHDHIFVPFEKKEAAMRVLKNGSKPS